MRHCSQIQLLKIGDKEGEISKEVLGFSEVYFQYFFQVGPRTFIAFPLEQEALLKIGYEVEFDVNWNFKSSKPIPALLENTMRPTAVLLNPKGAMKSKRLFMLGGQ